MTELVTPVIATRVPLGASAWRPANAPRRIFDERAVGFSLGSRHAKNLGARIKSRRARDLDDHG